MENSNEAKKLSKIESVDLDMEQEEGEVSGVVEKAKVLISGVKEKLKSMAEKAKKPDELEVLAEENIEAEEATEIDNTDEEIDMVIEEADFEIDQEKLSLDVLGLPQALKSLEGNKVDVRAAHTGFKIVSTLRERIQGANLNLNKESSKEGQEAIEAELEAIRKSLAFLSQEGINTGRIINGIARVIHAERNYAEMQRDPSKLQKASGAEQKITDLKAILQEGRSINIVGGREALSPEKVNFVNLVLKNDKLFEDGVDVIGEDGSTDRVDIMTFIDMVDNGEQVRVSLNEEEISEIEEEISALEEISNMEPPSEEERDRLKQEIDNATEILKVVTQTAGEVRWLARIWKKKSSAMVEGVVKDTSETLGFDEAQQDKLRKQLQRRRSEFFRRSLEEHEDISKEMMQVKSEIASIKMEAGGLAREEGEGVLADMQESFDFMTGRIEEGLGDTLIRGKDKDKREILDKRYKEAMLKYKDIKDKIIQDNLRILKEVLRGSTAEVVKVIKEERKTA